MVVFVSGVLGAAAALPASAEDRSGEDRLEASGSPRETGAESSTEPTRIASAAADRVDRDRVEAAGPTVAVRAIRLLQESQQRYASLRDYTCTFIKRERIQGRLTPPHVMAMKVRTQPFSVYFKYQQPNAGREAIYVAGRNQGKVVAHDVGLGRLVAGTMTLDPRGAMAMESNRHPITEAGIGHLITTLAEQWASDLRDPEARVAIDAEARVGARPCVLIESLHPSPKPGLLFHQVRLYLDRELLLPIHFEGYDWPRKPGARPELVEEYSYRSLKLNVGLSDADFDPNNTAYSYGRF